MFEQVQNVEALVLAWESNSVLKWIHVYLVTSLFAVGTCVCCVTALPLGLDQMPDASSSNVSSYIAWTVCSMFIGLFISEQFITVQINNTTAPNLNTL